MQKLLKISEVAGVLGLSRVIVYRLIRDDPDFPRPLYVRPRAPRFRQADIERWLERRAKAAA